MDKIFYDRLPCATVCSAALVPHHRNHVINLMGTATATRSMPDIRMVTDSKPAAGQSDIAGLDSDGDGYLDEGELEFGSDPGSAASVPGLQCRVLLAAQGGGIELRPITRVGDSYGIEASTNLEQWSNVENAIEGTGDIITRVYAIGNQPRRYFRARRE